jgi:hypothetical protein
MRLGDESLIHAYTSFGESADKIAAFPTVRREFLDRLAMQDDDGEVVWRLLQLRKAGKLSKDPFRRN